MGSGARGVKGQHSIDSKHTQRSPNFILMQIALKKSSLFISRSASVRVSCDNLTSICGGSTTQISYRPAVIYIISLMISLYQIWFRLRSRTRTLTLNPNLNPNPNPNPKSNKKSVVKVRGLRGPQPPAPI